jgi:hypothetical protein
MKFYFLTFFAFAILFSCKKQEDDAGNKLSTLQEKKWQLYQTKFIDQHGAEHINDLSTEQDYLKDDFTIWHKDNTYVISDNLNFNPDDNSGIVDTGVYVRSDNMLVTQSKKNPSTGTNQIMEWVNASDMCLSMKTNNPIGTYYYYYKTIP